MGNTIDTITTCRNEPPLCLSGFPQTPQPGVAYFFEQEAEMKEKGIAIVVCVIAAAVIVYACVSLPHKAMPIAAIQHEVGVQQLQKEWQTQQERCRKEEAIRQAQRTPEKYRLWMQDKARAEAKIEAEIEAEAEVAIRREQETLPGRRISVLIAGEWPLKWVEVRLGMSAWYVREKLGSPEDINSTTGSWGVHEQWVYKHTYLYFEDGILTTVQD